MSTDVKYKTPLETLTITKRIWETIALKNLRNKKEACRIVEEMIALITETIEKKRQKIQVDRTPENG